MKKLLTIAAILISSVTYGQIFQKSTTNNAWNRVKADSAMYVPLDTFQVRPATQLGQPVGDSGRIAYKNNRLWYRDLTSWKEISTGSPSGFVPTSRTLNMIGGVDLSIVGGTQDLSVNRSWTFNNTSTLATVAGRGNIANVPIYVTGNFIDIQGVSPFLGFNDGASSIRGLSGDLINVVDTGRFFKVINGVGGIEMLATDFNKATFNVLAEGVTPPAGAVGVEIPTAAWVRSRIGDSLANQNLQSVTNKGSITTNEVISNGGFRIATAPGGNGLFFSNASNTLRWIVRGLNTEGGSNSGYDLVFNGRTDAGGNMGDALTLQRSNLFVGVGVSAPTSRLHVAGSFATAITTTGSNITLTADHGTLIATSALTVTLPTAASAAGRIYYIVNYNTGGNVTFSIGVLKGGATVTTMTNNAAWRLQSNGTSWYVTGE